MPIIKPFLAGRKFSATIAAGTGTGATFAIAATVFTDDTGAAARLFQALFRTIPSILTASSRIPYSTLRSRLGSEMHTPE